MEEEQHFDLIQQMLDALSTYFVSGSIGNIK